MTKDNARSIAGQALSDLDKKLEQGKKQSLMTFLDTLAKFHRYSFGNVLLIGMQNPAATRVAGFNTWKKLGRYVRQGEKGITILAPLIYKSDDIKDDDDQEARELRGFKAVTVFDVSQTDGKPLPDIGSVNGDPAGYMSKLKDMIAGRRITLRYNIIPGGADGASSGGTITIRPNQTPAAEFSVLVHELAHEMLHKTKERPKSKTIIETEAEAVAYTVCQSINLAISTAASDYIRLYDGDEETLASSLNRIQTTAAEIIRQIHQEENAVA